MDQLERMKTAVERLEAREKERERLEAPLRKEIILDARARRDEGWFDRQIVSAQPKDLHSDQLLLECGHTVMAIPREGEVKHFCNDCADAWMRPEPEPQP
jgi:hypothetical protein